MLPGTNRLHRRAVWPEIWVQTPGLWLIFSPYTNLGRCRLRSLSSNTRRWHGRLGPTCNTSMSSSGDATHGRSLGAGRSEETSCQPCRVLPLRSLPDDLTDRRAEWPLVSISVPLGLVQRLSPVLPATAASPLTREKPSQAS